MVLSLQQRILHDNTVVGLSSIEVFAPDDLGVRSFGSRYDQ